MRVLIADDNRDSAETLAMMCETWGFDPLITYDGRQALEMLREPNSPMLCLLDWEMPGLTGVDICEEVRRENDRPYRYMILVTGRGERAEMVAGLDSGADDFLVKPVEADELRARLLIGKRVLDLQEQLKEQANRDGLTGLWNRTAIVEILERELTRGVRLASSLAIVLLDIDFFKAVNDSHGHLAGDQTLRQVAARLIQGLRPYDSIGRYGGEEFLVVLPGCCQTEALALAERLRDSLLNEVIAIPGGAIRVTASFGVAMWDKRSTAADFMRRADSYLYAAKRRGRNRVVGAGSDESES